MIAGATCAKDNSAASANRTQVSFQTTQSDLALLKIDASTHGVDNGFGLFIDFFLHKMLEFAFHDVSNLNFESLDGPSGSFIVFFSL